jgi:hypothetical protein
MERTMKKNLCARLWKSLAPSFALIACASPGGAGKGEWAPPPWPSGHYDLRATVSYRMDTEGGTRTERMEIRADLIVGPGGSMSLQSSSGLCRQQTQLEIDRDRVRGQMTFPCQETTYILKPLGGTVGGEVLVRVSEGYRTRGACMRYEQTAGGGRVCVQYSWEVRFRESTKRARLTVTRVS